MTDVNDFRYRILVMLRKSERPKYFDFHCMLCQMKVCELSGTDVRGFDDMADVYVKTTKGVRCPGRYRGAHCYMWYYFEDLK